MSNNVALDFSDVEKLMSDSSASTRVDLTNKITSQYNSENLTDKELKIIEQIFQVLMKDAEVKVRKALSEGIKDSTKAPKDMVVALAKDVEEVSLPVLEFSELLTDEDLINIIEQSEGFNKKIAISKRETVSEAVSESLIDNGNADVVESLLRNENAHVSENGYTKIVDKFPDQERVIDTMTTYRSLSVDVIERMAASISDSIYRKITSKSNNIFEGIDDVIKQSREIATMQLMGLQSTSLEFQRLMGKLKTIGKLSPITALCMANISVFEITMARMTHIPVDNIKKLVHDVSDEGFRALYDRADMPQNLYAAALAVIQELRLIQGEKKDGDSSDNASDLIERLALRVKQGEEIQNLSYIITLIKQNTSL